MKKIFLLLSVSLATLNLHAQQKEFVFKNFTQEEGLPSNEAYYVFEDSRHYIWIATDLGVVRYNGNKFEQYNLPDNVVFKIREDSKGRIWFFSHKALLAYFENEKMQIFKHNSNIVKRIEKLHVIDCRIDEKDNILLNSYLDSNFTISQDGAAKAYSHYYKPHTPTIFTIDCIKGNNCFTTMNQRGGGMAEDSFYLTVNRKNKQVKYFVPIEHFNFAHYGSTSADGKEVYFFAGRTLLRLNEDGSFSFKLMPSKILSINTFKGNVFVGLFTKGGVLLSPDLSSQIADIVLPNKSITSIATDYEGGLWLSTLENGVYYAKNTFITHLVDKDPADAYVSRVMNVNDSTMIYSKSTGLYNFSDKGVPFFKYNNLLTIDLFTDKNNNLYLFGSTANVFESRKINTAHFKNIYLFDSPSEHARLSEDSLIIGTSNEVFLVKNSNLNKENLNKSNLLHWPYANYDYKKLLSKQSRLFVDANRNIWAGANDGLYKSTTPYDTLLKFHPASIILNQGISCLNQMENGMIAAGIRFSGIVLINDTGIVANITEKEGLSSNKVRFLLPVNGQLWAATAKGVSVIKFSSFNPVNYSITNIGKNDGFYNVTIHQLIHYQKSIVAATSNGLYFIEAPDVFLKKKLPEIPFYINNVSTFSGDSTITNISLPYSKNRVAIKYSAISFNSYESINYLYRFMDGDTVWYSTTNTERLLDNFEPGTYNLQIQAEIPSQQRSSQVRTISIIIEKPWWQNNWFRLFAAIVISGMVYWFVRTRIRKVKAEAKRKTDLNAKLAELEQTALRAQMNPHFIFNCLTSIQQLIISGNKTDASEYLVKFSRLIRKTLDMSAKSFIPISEEKEYLKEYLFLEQLRLSGQFEYTITADASIDTLHTLIPNMMIQPVVENCVRHGIKPLEGREGNIAVVFSQAANTITCTISDNGVGRNSISPFNETNFTTHKSYGIDIVRKRLETFSEFNGGESGVGIEDLYDAGGNPCGTKVILQLPYKKTI